MKLSNNKIQVTHFQRKSRPGFNFSIENIFENLRLSLKDMVDFEVAICSLANNGYLSKLVNIIEAALRQKTNAIAHITGEVHFLNLLMRKKKVLLTIHDCRFMERKKGFAKRMIGWLYLKAPVRKAEYITTVSAATKAAVIDYTNCPEKKIIVIPVSVDNIFQPSPKAFNKTCPAILQIGTAANKNVARLTEALKGIKCRLIIIGEPSAAELKKLNDSGINFLIKQNLSKQELYQEYINCDIVSFISTYEGFGMPIVEANSVERVVITSGISAMPEVAGNAACLVNPYNVDEIRKSIQTIIHDDAYRNQLIANGRINKQRFNSKYVADSYLALYKKMTNHTCVNE